MNVGRSTGGDSSDEDEAAGVQAVVIDAYTSGIVRWITAVSIVVVAALFWLDYRVNYLEGSEHEPIQRLFNMTREDGLGSWVMVTLTQFTALTAWMVTLTVRAMGAGSALVRGWAVVALGLSWMACDDGAEIHERVATAVASAHRSAAAAAEEVGALGTALEAFPSYHWHVVILPLFGLMGLYFLAFLGWNFRSGTERWLLVGCLLSFAVAVALDFAEGLHEKHPMNVYQFLARQFGLEPGARAHFFGSPIWA